MSNINLNINFNPKVVIAILAVIGITTFAYKIPETKAQTSPALTGKYGCLGNSNAAPYMISKQGQEVWMNFIGIIDMDTRTANGTSSATSNFNAENTIQNNYVTTSATFTIVQGPFPGSYTVTYSSGAIDTFVPVNSGNTILSKSVKTGPGTMTDTTVCQKI
jgi:hypothetical protein